jgi:hypothetical membrane protein
MEFDNRRVAGTILSVGTVQFIMLMIIAEILYPNYSVSDNYISDLGVGPSAFIFNSSVFLLGLMVVAGAYFLYRVLHSRLLSVLLILTGVGAMGVGLFTEAAGGIHAVFSLITFLFGGISAIAFYKVEKTPFNWLSIILGAMGLMALVLFASGNYVGLGPGGMERMVAYPMLLWGVGFGGHLIGSVEQTSTTIKT